MRDKILSMLQEGQEISGEAISRALNISRAAVGKHIQVLREAGYQIAAAPRRGYRLISAPDLLNQIEIGRWLPPDSPWRIDDFPELDTTMREARRLAEEGAAEYRVVIAERQTAGIGRLGRPWYGPAGSGLWMALLFRPHMAPTEAQQLTLCNAVAIAETLTALGFPVGIKWPNDILSLHPDYPHRKLCGIRTEMRADSDRVEWLISGIGVNINMTEFPPELQDIACSLRMLQQGRPLRRSQLAAALLQQIEQTYRQLSNSGFAELRQRWLAHAVGIGEQVSIHAPNGMERGIATGMDEAGYLLLLPEDGGPERRILAGDMVLRT